MSENDTIAAIATPPGRGSIGVLRISGPLTTLVANELLGKIPQPRRAEYLPFRNFDSTTLDQGIALFFLGPNSFTGEDVLELQGHGSPVILDLLLQRVLALPGVRIARPGEFSERAFLNDKLDLVQAEAIADLIDASSAQAARSAIKSLQGAFSIRINQLIDTLNNLRVHIEAGIDFPDEEIDHQSFDQIEIKLNDVMISINQVFKEVRQGSILREGIKVVIAGRPNVGKSSLLNVLAGYQVAIVTAIAGTTRDVLHESINLDGVPFHIIDTAGLHDTFDEIESIGIKRAWSEIKQADHILLIVDSVNTPCSDLNLLLPTFITNLPEGVPVTVVRNKADLTGENVGTSKVNNFTVITLSAKSGDGIDLLRKHLKYSIDFVDNTEGVFLARRRHIEALEVVTQHILQGQENFRHTYSSDLLAEDLRLAQKALSEITGTCSSDELLRQIFSNFCIGK